MTLSPQHPRFYTYEDYLQWDDGKRYELIQGKRYEMLSAPNRRHQKISLKFTHEIIDFFDHPDSSCELYVAPFDVRLPKNQGETNDKAIFTVVQPDLSVVCDPEKLDERGCLGAPDWVIEILSQDSKRDVETKFKVYEAAGVREYWIIHPSESTLTTFVRDEKEQMYGGGKMYPYDAVVSPHIFPEVKIDLAKVFDLPTPSES
ncbi:MAG: Uma2 family endonuclease [Bacteroidota bacterium]